VFTVVVSVVAPLLHENVAGPLVTAVSRAEPPAGQLGISVAPIEHVGGGLLVTDAVAALVQPVAELLTVTVYVPEQLTVGFAVVLPEIMHGPDQLKLTPAVEELALMIIDVVVQVNCPPVALAPGACLS